MLNLRVISPILVVLALCLFAATPASSQKLGPTAALPAKAEPAKVAAEPRSLLPEAFSGWEAGDRKTVADPAQVDSAHAAALREFGLTDAVLGSFTRGKETLTIKALRFGDASGAYGAYSFYRHPGWPKENIGSGAASNGNRVLFWQGNVFVDASFQRVSPMSGAELRELAKSIPVPAGNKSLAPPILGNLPTKDMDGQTTHYALGPAGYLGVGGAGEPYGVLTPELVGFDRGAETATASYKLRSGPATLTLINYPTPQMAAAQEKAIAEYLKAGNTPQHPFSKLLQESNPAALEVRRSGPLVAVVSGDAIPDEAHKLIELVHYEADMAEVPGGGGTNDIQKTAQLMLGIVTLVVVMFIAAFVVAIFLGAGRATWRVLRGKPASSLNDEQFTKLDL